jgi:predicted ATPase
VWLDLETAGDASGSPGALAGLSEVIPTSLRQYIEQQLEQLTEADQVLLEAASVAGSTFTIAAVAAGVAQAPETLEARLTALARQGRFIRASGTETWPDGTVTACYQFLHALYHEVVYARVSAGHRVRLHQQIGACKETGYGAQAWEIAAELALHFERGGGAGRAVAYRRQAATNALERWANQEAIVHLTRGLEALQRLPETAERLQQELAMQTTLGRALIDTRGYTSPEVLQAYTRAHLLCRQVGDTPQLFQVLQGLQLVYYTRGELQTAHELAEQLLSMAQGLSDRTLLIVAYGALGRALCTLGELARAHTHLEEGMALSDPQRKSGYEGTWIYLSAWTLWVLGYPDQALQRVHQALTLTTALSFPYALAGARFHVAVLHQFRREAQGALQQAAALTALAREHGFALGIARGTILWGWALAAQGQGAEGVSRICEGLSAFEAMGAVVDRSYWLALLTEAYGKGAQVEDGLTVLAEALAMVSKAGEHFYEAELYRLKGELLLTQADRRQTATCNKHRAEEGEACFQQALAIARRQGAKAWELRAATSLAHLWQHQGKRAEAYELLAPIYGWFTEGFDTADLQEAKALLDALA